MTGSDVPGIGDGAVFRSLFAAYPDSLLLVDTDGVIRLANPAAVALLGYSADELVGLPVDALVPDAIRPRHAAYRKSYAEQPRTRPMGTQMDLVAKRRDGRQVMVEIALSPLQDQGLPYVVAAIRSVSDYPRVKQALQRARYAECLAQFGRLAVDAREAQRLLELVPAMASEALQVDAAMVLLAEPSGLEFRVAAGVGLLPEESVGSRIAQEPASALAAVASDGKPVAVSDYAHEQRFVLPPRYAPGGIAGELLVAIADRGRVIGVLAVRSGRPRLFGEDEIQFLGSLSSMLATVLQRASSEEALNHAQRLETVGQLTGGVAHDFNNLLTVISGNLQVLEDTPAFAGDPFIQQLVGAATRATRRGAELTSKLLAFSRRQVLEPIVVDTAALLQSLTDMLRRTLDQRIVITLAAEEVFCLADPVQLESALLNVAINARDAMPQGGMLAFGCTAVATPPADLDLEDGRLARHGYVAISVKDTGVGMSQAVRERAFEPFFTTKESGRGTGLGLSTVYGFARQSQGTIRLDSAPGAGTTVTLYLPRVEIDAEAGACAETASAQRIPAGLRVLLVEDDAEVRAVMEKFLAAMGCEIVPCSRAETALELLASEPDIGLLLTDILLGTGMRGTDLAAVAHEQRPRLPILLMSGYSSGLLEQPQPWALLRKPCTRAELELAIAKVLG